VPDKVTLKPQADLAGNATERTMLSTSLSHPRAATATAHGGDCVRLRLRTYDLRWRGFAPSP